MRFFVNIQLVGTSILNGLGRLLTSFNASTTNYRADLETLRFFSNNQAALDAGLEPGELYLSSTDPYTLCVVIDGVSVSPSPSPTPSPTPSPVELGPGPVEELEV